MRVSCNCSQQCVCVSLHTHWFKKHFCLFLLQSVASECESRDTQDGWQCINQAKSIATSSWLNWEQQHSNVKWWRTKETRPGGDVICAAEKWKNVWSNLQERYFYFLCGTCVFSLRVRRFSRERQPPQFSSSSSEVGSLQHGRQISKTRWGPFFSRFSKMYVMLFIFMWLIIKTSVTLQQVYQGFQPGLFHLYGIKCHL